MNDKLRFMMKKGSFEAYHLTETACLKVQGHKPKVVDNYFLFDGKQYYFGNQFVKLSSTTSNRNRLIMATTGTKMFIPQDTGDDLYIARNYVANEDLLAVILYCHDDLIYYQVVSGKGSGRVHPVCLPFTEEGYKFCFHFAMEAIAAVDPELAQSIYTSIRQKCAEVMAELSEQE